jgi:hypothetical protein
VGDEAAPRTGGERFFEEYLGSVGITNFAFEEDVKGTRKKPDYRITLDGEINRFDVKQFDPTPEDLPVTFGCFGPYPLLREKIEAARRKFKGLKGSAPCSLVLFNNGRPLVFLSPQPVYEAMFGDVGWTIPFDTSTGAGDDTRMKREFLGHGKMFRYSKDGKQRVAAQNTTISAIVVVSEWNVGERRLAVALARRRLDLGRELSGDERFAVLDDWGARDPGIREVAIRVRIYENPLAIRPLSPSFGRGPWDQRFGRYDDSIVRLFVGPELAKLEADQEVVGIDVDPWKW